MQKQKFSIVLSPVAAEQAHVYLKIQDGKQRHNFSMICILPWVHLLLSCLLPVFNYFFITLSPFSYLYLD